MSSSDDLDQWEAVIAQAVLDVAAQWEPRVLAAALPSLTAAGGLPPDPDRMDDEHDSWWRLFMQQLGPVLSGLMASRTWRVLSARHVTPPWVGESAVSAVPWPVDVFAALTPDEQAGLVTTFAELRALADGLIPDTAEQIVHIPSWRDHTADYLAHVAGRCRSIPDTVFAQIRRDLTEGIHAGESAHDLATRVRDHLDMNTEGGREAWNTRARLIARTEATGAYNAASLEAARIETAETGEHLQQEWVASMDGRTRAQHFAADGQRRNLDQPFTVGGHRLRYPGDPTAPASETANCRCTTVIVTAGDDSPRGQDRQTERARADGQRRDPAAEVRDRAAQGVTRARDDPAHAGTVTADAQPQEAPMTRRSFTGILAPIGAPTGDGRIFDPDATIAFRDFPLPLMWQRSTSEGHDQSVIVGRIDTATVEDGEIRAQGVLFESGDAAEAAQLLGDEVVRPSVDLCDMVADFLVVDADGAEVDPELCDDPSGLRELMVVREMTVMGATLVAKPAFAEAKLALGEPVESGDTAGEVAALTAAAALAEPVVVPSAAFAAPNLPGPTAVTVTNDGRVYGHLALWGTEHIGMPGRGITPPRSHTGYALFHVSTITTDTGPMSCGRLTVGCGHADPRSRSAAAADHYDHAGACWAYVRAGEDQHGIWVAGVLNPDADPAAVHAGASAPLSGDWRQVGGNLELVAALSVNTPGFPVPRSYAATPGAELSLVAAGAVRADTASHSVVTSTDIAAAVDRALTDWHARQDRQREAAAIRDRHARTEAATITARHLGASK